MQNNKDEIRQSLDAYRDAHDDCMKPFRVGAIRQQAAEIERLREERDKTLAEWGKTLSDAETIAARVEAAERERDEYKNGASFWHDYAKKLEIKLEQEQRNNAALREYVEWCVDEDNLYEDWVGRARTLLAELDREDTQPKECKTCNGMGGWNDGSGPLAEPVPCPDCVDGILVEDTQGEGEQT